jgi:hypothetical protein
MSPLSLLLLRRAALYALVFAVILLTVPRLLTAIGVLGPSVDEEIASVEGMLQAAQAYGAGAGDPEFGAATQALDRARAAAARSERFSAKRALVLARDHAIRAQRAALATREEARRQAQKIVLETDRAVNELEDLYSQATRGLDKQTTSRLLAMMKATRQKAASLWLAFEEGNFDRVVEDEPAVREVLRAARSELREARGAAAVPR